MKTLIPFTIVACALLVGCSHAPFKAPNVSSLYAVPTYLERAKDESTPALDDPIGTQALAVAKKHAYEALSEANEVDHATKFKVENDLAAIGIVAGAGVGALVNAHSDLYKSLGALLGLSIGLDVYLSPTEQSAVYLKAAKAFSCSADQMYNIARYTTKVTPDDVNQLRGALPGYEREAKSLLYSNDLQTKLKGTNPFFAAKVIQIGVTAEANTAATTEVLDFLSGVQIIGNARRKAILLYTVEEIRKVSYDRDKALKKITGFSMPPKDVISTLQTLNPGLSAYTVSGGAEQLNQNLPAIIDAINNYQGCIEPLEGK